MPNKRYFDGESEPKFKAGVISESLREALDLRRGELPSWIYRMRVLGYPPGWLKVAEMNTLSLIDDSNCGHSRPNALLTHFEDGEIGGVQYNRDSFIEYPGFNVPYPTHTRDDWYRLGMPPMLPQQQLKEALKTMKLNEPLNVPYKRLKTDAKSTPPSPSNHKSQNKSVDNSHSLANDSNEVISLDESGCEIIEILDATDTEDTANDSSQASSKLNNTLNSSNSSDGSRKLKLVSMGSPMPVSSNPSRPSLEKWSVGMGELIYFENLPTSTGMYKNKMKTVIDKIRQKTKES